MQRYGFFLKKQIILLFFYICSNKICFTLYKYVVMRHSSLKYFPIVFT